MIICPMSPTGLFIATILPLVFLWVGGYMVIYSLVDSARARRSFAWPSVMGTVLTSLVFKDESDTSGYFRPTYRADISYEYDVHGSRYVSNRVLFGDRTGSSWGKRKAERLVARYQPKQRVDVYYDRKKPKVSVLEKPSTNSSNTGNIVIGLIVLGIGIFGLLA